MARPQREGPRPAGVDRPAEVHEGEPSRGGPAARGRRWIRGLSLSLLTLVLLLGGAELTLRLRGYDPLGQFTAGRLQAIRASRKPDLAYELTPGTDTDFRGARLKVNSHGFRGREYAVEKPPGVLRIVVIGDSVAFGDRLEAEERFSERMEELAREDGRALEVPNLAVGGYDVVDAVASLEHVGLAFDPDVVVYAYCINDAGTQSFNLQMIRTFAEIGPVVRHSRLAQYFTVTDLLRRAGHQYSWLNTEEGFLETFGAHVEPLGETDPVRGPMRELEAWLEDQPRPPAYLPWYTSPNRVGRLRHGFGRLARLADEHGFEPVLFFVPYLNEEGRERGLALAHEIVDLEATRAGIRTLDLREEFREAGHEGLAAYPEGPDVLHPNALGHELMARRLYHELVEGR